PVTPRAPHSYPTRRSSDLDLPGRRVRGSDGGDCRRPLGAAAHPAALAGAAERHGGLRPPGPPAVRGRPPVPKPSMGAAGDGAGGDRKSTRLNSSHVKTTYA